MKHIYGPNNDYPLQFGRPHRPLKWVRDGASVDGFAEESDTKNN